MRSFKRALAGAGALAVVAASLAGSGATVAQSTAPAVDCKVGVSWNNFAQPRWAATDKPSMFKVITDGGGTVLPDKDANLNTLQQITDVNTLIEQGADVLVLLAQDTKAIGPALLAAKDNDIPVIAYDRLIEDPGVLYITFDNQGVGEAEARAVMSKVPEGNYVVIKGDVGDPNAAIFLRAGYDVAGLKDAVDAGKITILDEQFTPGWIPRRPRTRWRPSSTRPPRTARPSTRCWQRTTARRSASRPLSWPRHTTPTLPSAGRTATPPT